MSYDELIIELNKIREHVMNSECIMFNDIVEKYLNAIDESIAIIERERSLNDIVVHQSAEEIFGSNAMPNPETKGES